jgi:dihydrolipoamide dehydrogenase
LVDKGTIGGVCLNWGCIPSKALIHAGKLYEEMQHASEMGITVENVQLDLTQTQKWKQSVIDKLTGGIEQIVKANGGEILLGKAVFDGPKSIVVTGDDGAQTKVNFEQAVIACGSSPIQIPGFEIDEKNVVTSQTALSWKKAPKRLAVIGGGVIGMEIGMMYQKFGSEVTVVELADQLLPGTDSDIAKTLLRICKKRNIQIHLKTKALGYQKTDQGLSLEIETSKGKESIACDTILLSVGRAPNAKGLGLDQAGVKTERGRVLVNQTMQTNIPYIYAIGDVAGGALLAHKASKEGLVAAEHIAGLASAYDVKAMPGAIFTDPEIGAVGMTEAQAKEKGIDVIVGNFPFAASGKALSMGSTDGFVKLVGRKSDHVLLGAHIIGPHASDLISEATLAIEMGATIDDLALTVHAHPTTAETLMEASEVALGHPIHVVQKKSSKRG